MTDINQRIDDTNSDSEENSSCINQEKDEWSFCLGIGKNYKWNPFKAISKQREAKDQIHTQGNPRNEAHTPLQYSHDCNPCHNHEHTPKYVENQQPIGIEEELQAGRIREDLLQDQGSPSDTDSAYNDDSLPRYDAFVPATGDYSQHHDHVGVGYDPGNGDFSPVNSPQYSKQPKASFAIAIDRVKRKRLMEASSKISIRGPKRFFKSDSLSDIKQKSLLRFRKFQREFRAAKIIGLIIGTFIILWTPFMLVVILSSLKVPVSYNMVMTAKCLHYANSAINPILYVVLNRMFRKGVKKALFKICLIRVGQRGR